MKVRKKPVIVDAVQITSEWFDRPHPSLLHSSVEISPKVKRKLLYNPVNKTIQIKTLEGTMVGNVGDWIITGVKGEVYPCKSGIFEATYEKVE